MKIKSITDVITNSSSEVFTLRTDKTLEEVWEWLKENVKWTWNKPTDKYPFTKPEIMEKGLGVLDWLVDFGDLWDSNDKDDVEDYKIKHCLNYAIRSYSGNYDFVIKPKGLVLKRHWEKFCEENMEELLTYFPSTTKDQFWERYYRELDYYSNTLYPSNNWTSKYDSFIKKFIEYYEKECPKCIPEWWKIPEVHDVQYWKGKIGFSTTDENSISWDDMEKIIDEFGGIHWHMG